MTSAKPLGSSNPWHSGLPKQVDLHFPNEFPCIRKVEDNPKRLGLDLPTVGKNGSRPSKRARTDTLPPTRAGTDEVDLQNSVGNTKKRPAKRRRGEPSNDEEPSEGSDDSDDGMLGQDGDDWGGDTRDSDDDMDVDKVGQDPKQPVVWQGENAKRLKLRAAKAALLSAQASGAGPRTTRTGSSKARISSATTPAVSREGTVDQSSQNPDDHAVSTPPEKPSAGAKETVSISNAADQMVEPEQTMDGPEAWSGDEDDVDEEGELRERAKKLMVTSPAWFHDRYAKMADREGVLGEMWPALLAEWTLLEAGSEFTQGGRNQALPGKSIRPGILNDWIDNGRIRESRLEMPRLTLPELKAFKGRYRAWWDSMQPAWRVRSGKYTWSQQGHDAEEMFDILDLRGQNGWMSIVACLWWWGMCLADAEVTGAEKDEWEGALGDAVWTVREIRINVEE